MAEDRRGRVWELFDEAADLPPEARAAFLDAACRGAPELRAEVESLLAHDADEDAAGVFKSPLLLPSEQSTDPPLPAAPSEIPVMPAHVGHYRVLRLLGEGGMGTVYEAEQDNPRRAVALKVIRPGLTSAHLVKRFAHEAQVLGRLHHPGIAQIYEAGLVADGQPFFAMELILGLPLTEYARNQRLDAAARLDLLARVCDAVQHAHDKGVIHRDLKPGNILVDESGQPKVLDFGVARATDADLLTTTVRTEAGQLVGTPRYMSPEQVTADPATLDRRSDVYALGVILFELLADRLPYHLEHLPLAEVGRVICEQEPSRLGSVDARFRGDVETIAAKALEKDKARRYSSAGELASDLRRHLSHEPILARAPSALYHLRKFTRRNKALVGGLAGVMAAVVLGAIFSFLFAVRANDERREALAQTYRARLAAAVAALQGHDVADAARQLDEAPEVLRDWEWRHLKSRLDDSSAVIPAPSGSLPFLLRGPDGLRVGGFTDAGLRLTDEDGRERLTLPPRPRDGSFFLVRQARDGFRLVDARRDGTVRLVDEGGKELLSLAGAGKAIPSALALSPDQTRLAVAWTVDGARFVIGLYDTTSGEERARCDGGHTEEVRALAFSPDGTRLASASDDFTARLWDVATGRPAAAFKGHTLKVLVVAFRPDGARVLTASADGTVRQWDPTTGEEVGSPYDRHTGEVLTAAYSPDGEWVASGGTDRTVRLWEAKGRREVALLHGHTGAVRELAFAPDGRRLASTSEDGTARVWETGATVGLPVLRGHGSYVYPTAWSPDGRWIASGSWDKTVRLWDALTGEACATLSHPGVVETLAFTPDSLSLISGCQDDDRLRVWDVATGRLRTEFKGPGRMRALAIDPDGARVAAMDWKGNLSILDAATGEEVVAIPLSDADRRRPLAYSPDGLRLAVFLADQDVGLWDTRTRRMSAPFVGHAGAIHSLAFSRDGRRLVSTGADRTVRVWDVDTGKCQVLRGHTDDVYAAVFHPDGTRIASAGRDRAIWLWDVATGREAVRLQGHTNYVWSLAFSPDGKTLLSGSGDGTLRLWDTEPLARRHQARREAEALRPEAERLVERLFREKKEAGAVAAALQADESLTEPLRRAAARAVLRR